MVRSGQSDETGSRGPVREMGGGGPDTLPADGAVRLVRRDWFTRTAAGDGVREALAAPFYRKIAMAGSFRGRSLGR